MAIESKGGKQASRRTGVDRARCRVRKHGGEEGEVEGEGGERRERPACQRGEHAIAGWRRSRCSGRGRFRPWGGDRRVEDGVGGPRCRDGAVERVERVDVAPKLGLDVTLHVGGRSGGVTRAHVVVGPSMLDIEQPSAASDAEGVLSALLKIVLVIRRAGIIGLAVELAVQHGVGHGGRRLGDGKTISGAVRCPQFVKADSVAHDVDGALRRWGALGRGLVACLPAVPGETKKRVSPCLVGLFNVFGIFVACVGVRKTLGNGASGVWRRRLGVEVVPGAVFEPLTT
eukprot:6213051-Pleurochrysis_carterae.AAC.6